MKSKFFFLPSLVLVAMYTIVAQAVPTDLTAGTRTISPNIVEPDQFATVTIDLTGEQCVGATDGIDVVLAVDRSGSMYDDCASCSIVEDRITPATNAAKSFLERLDFSTDRIGIVAFAGTFDMDILGFETSEADLVTLLDDLPQRSGSTTGTAIGTAINEAEVLFLDAPPQDNAQAIVVLSDGQNLSGATPSIAVESACDAGIDVFTIGLGSDIDASLPDLACNEGAYFEAPTVDDLDQIYQSVADIILKAAARDAIITESVPTGLTVANISNSGQLTGSVITWDVGQIEINTTVSYQVTSSEIDTAYLFQPGSASYSNCNLEAAVQSIDGASELKTSAPTSVVLTHSNTMQVSHAILLLVFGGFVMGTIGCLYKKSAL